MSGIAPSPVDGSVQINGQTYYPSPVNGAVNAGGQTYYQSPANGNYYK